jgi:exonuclease III
VELNGYDVDIAIIPESHITKHEDCLVKMEGYQLFRRDRVKRQGGGVAVYVRSCMTVIEMKFEGDSNVFELPWLQVKYGTRGVVIGDLYHPPKPIYEADALLDYIEASLDTIASSHNNAFVIIAGDLNTLPKDEIVAQTARISSMSLRVVLTDLIAFTCPNHVMKTRRLLFQQ